MLFILFLIFLWTPAVITAIPGHSAEEWDNKIHYNLIVKDFDSACENVNKALSEYPECQMLHRRRILVYASADMEKEALQAWMDYCASFDEREEDISLLEAVAWSVLQRGITSPAPLTRLAALMGAGSTRDIKTYSFLQQSLRDSCAIIRCAACQLAAQMRYRQLVPLLLHLAEHDRFACVRKVAITALASLKEPQAKALILRRLPHGNIPRDERYGMAKALAVLDEKSPEACFKNLIASRDHSLRSLGAEYAANMRLVASAPLLIQMLEDSHTDVQIDALHALAVLWPQWNCDENMLQKIRQRAYSEDGMLGSAASWVLALCSKEEGLKRLEELIESPHSHIRIHAASVASALGGRAIPLLKKNLRNPDSDPYVKLNAALALLCLREEKEEAWRWIEHFFDDREPMLSQLEWGPLKACVSGQHVHNEMLSPELMDLSVRLEILNLLAIVKAPCAEHALKNCLGSRVWGVSGIATMLLLTEGNESGLGLIQRILEQAATPQLQLQAALILALWGKSDAAAAPLLKAYEGAGRETKERILGALGSIGSEQAIPFLSKALLEPAASLRVQAASALLQVIYK